MAASLNLTLLNTTLGAYCIENKSKLMAEILLQQSFSEKFTVMAGVKDQVPLPQLYLSNISKPLDYVNFTPTANAITPEARILQVRPVKVDVRIYPQELYNTWLGQYASPGAAPNLILEAFIMQEIAKKAYSENHLLSLYKGIYNSGGTTPTDSYDGWLRLIALEVAAANISVANNNLVATGALTAANIITSVESVFDKLADQYKTMPTQMLVSPTNYMLYQRAYRLQFGQNQDYNGMENVLGQGTVLDGTLCRLIPEPGMAGSNRIICTIKENMYYGVDLDSDINEPRTQVDHRSIDIMMDWRVGVQFRQIKNGILVVNDQI